jgi:hypothetical protein
MSHHGVDTDNSAFIFTFELRSCTQKVAQVYVWGFVEFVQFKGKFELLDKFY